MRFVTVALAALACLRSGPVPAANLVVNGGFESVNISGLPSYWNNGGNWFSDNGTITGTPPYQGAWSAAEGGCGSWDDFSQVIPTRAGETYTLRFAFNPGAYAGPLPPRISTRRAARPGPSTP